MTAQLQTPAKEECRLQCPSAGQDKEETYIVGEAPIKEGKDERRKGWKRKNEKKKTGTKLSQKMLQV